VVSCSLVLAQRQFALGVRYSRVGCIDYLHGQVGKYP
jgi:hypothetical protein